MTTKLLTLCGGLAVLAAAAAAQPPARLPAFLPPEVEREIPADVRQQVEEGRIPWEAFAQSLGFPVNPQAVSEIQEKRFVVHWLYHYTGLSAAIDEDPVGEGSITGRCSGAKLTDAADAPAMYPNFWASPGIGTSYWQAPSDSTSCTTDRTDITFYKLTWVKSPAAQEVQAWFGSSDYFKLWINGVLVGSRVSGGPKPYTVGEYRYTVNLKAGWNLIVVRQTFPQLGPGDDPDPDNRSKYFSLRFVRDASGTPVTDLVATYDPDPTCGERAGREQGPNTKVLIPSVAHLPGSGGSQGGPTWRSSTRFRGRSTAASRTSKRATTPGFPMPKRPSPSSPSKAWWSATPCARRASSTSPAIRRGTPGWRGLIIGGSSGTSSCR